MTMTTLKCLLKASSILLAKPFAVFYLELFLSTFQRSLFYFAFVRVSAVDSSRRAKFLLLCIIPRKLTVHLTQWSNLSAPCQMEENFFVSEVLENYPSSPRKTCPHISALQEESELFSEPLFSGLERESIARRSKFLRFFWQLGAKVCRIYFQGVQPSKE